MQRKRIAEATKGVGRPKVGGDFELVDQDGKPFSSADMKGRYSLVSSAHLSTGHAILGFRDAGLTDDVPTGLFWLLPLS